jgi:hypothetical protein
MKNKTTGPNMSQWKEFRYNLIKEDIELDGDHEDNLRNSFDEPEPFTYQLKNGKTLEIEETDGPGMAGEPMTFTILKIDGKTVHFDDIKHLMEPKDAQELEQYLDEVGGSNAASADNWVREGKKSTKYFDVVKWRETQKKKVVKENVIKEDGGDYQVNISIVSSASETEVWIKDNQGDKQHKQFIEIKDAHAFLINYLNQWDLS